MKVTVLKTSWRDFRWKKLFLPFTVILNLRGFNCVMESLTTEKLAKSRCFPVKILLINHSRSIISLFWLLVGQPRFQGRSDLLIPTKGSGQDIIACVLVRVPGEETLWDNKMPFFPARPAPRFCAWFFNSPSNWGEKSLLRNINILGRWEQVLAGSQIKYEITVYFRQSKMPACQKYELFLCLFSRDNLFICMWVSPLSFYASYLYVSPQSRSVFFLLCRNFILPRPVYGGRERKCAAKHSGY